MKKILIHFFILFFLTSCSKINTFGYGKKKEKNIYEENMVNEYLWKSSYKYLANYSELTSLLEEGVISTNWISPKKNKRVRFKIIVYILGPKLLEDNVSIVAEKQIKTNGEWKKGNLSTAFTTNLKTMIVQKAKDLDPSDYGKMEEDGSFFKIE